MRASSYQFEKDIDFASVNGHKLNSDILHFKFKCTCRCLNFGYIPYMFAEETTADRRTDRNFTDFRSASFSDTI